MSKPVADAESLSLTVTLAGRPYPLRVLPADEEPIRRIAKELNDKVVEYQRAYSGKDKQDCLAMLLFIYAVDLYKAKASEPPAADQALAPTLARLERDLAAALHGGPEWASAGDGGGGADDGTDDTDGDDGGGDDDDDGDGDDAILPL